MAFPNVERLSSTLIKKAELGIAFDAFFAENGIKHIMGRAKHPQTADNIEKWHYICEKEKFARWL